MDQQCSAQSCRLDRQLEDLAALAVAKGLSIVTAESCTGGLIGGWITSLPGSSVYYKGGIISYSNDIKEKLLGVDAEVLAAAGAVSPQVAAAMAGGAARVLEGDLAIAVTGIAGPQADGTEKPVGLVYIGIFYQGREKVFPFQFFGSRQAIRQQTAEAAIALALEALKGNWH